MIRIHYYKVHPEIFKEIKEGYKTHEIRKDDRQVRPRPGDILVLKEFNPNSQTFTGNLVTRLVTYVSEPGTFGLPSDLFVMSIIQVPVHVLTDTMDWRYAIGDRKP